ncbi:MAG: AAA family ATPase, partial [Armatimonadetes bacterium]|nr:AAA family ATPase [Armatimonadota bacterium]
MLIQFTVTNFLSFDNETVFSMLADGGDGQHPDHLLINPARKKEALVRGAAIYGANAAGKSNLIEALAFAQNRIVKGSRGNQTIPVEPFRLDPSANDKASGFEFIFQHNEFTYSYGFRATKQRIEEEWLFATSHRTHSREHPLFERTTDAEGK